MHDLTHDLAVFVGEKIYKQFETETPITSRASIRHVSFTEFSEVRFDGNVHFGNWTEVRSLTIGSIDQLIPRDLAAFETETPCKEVLGEISCRLLFLRVLCLCGYWIHELPDTIGDLRLLRSLEVHSFNIKELPASLRNLSNLRYLDWRFSLGLQELPDRIGNLVSLRYLDVSSTAIKDLPASLCCLSNLEQLKCSHCDQLRSLPNEMGNLVCLRDMNVSSTKIKELPTSLCFLPNLKKLVCHGCDCLQQLPDGIGDIVSLQYLDFEGASVEQRELPTSLCDANRWEISYGKARRVNP